MRDAAAGNESGEDEGTPSKRPAKCSPGGAAAAAAAANGANATGTALAVAAAAAPEAEPGPRRRRRARSRAGSVCAVDDAIGSIRIDNDDEGDDDAEFEFGREQSLGAGSDVAAAAAAPAAASTMAAADEDENKGNCCFYFQRHSEVHRPATVAEACLDLLACEESAADVLASAPKQQRGAVVAVEEKGEGGEEAEKVRAVAAVAAETVPAPAPLSQTHDDDGGDDGDNDDDSSGSESEGSEEGDSEEEDDKEAGGHSAAREAELRELLGNLLAAEGAARPCPDALLERHGLPSSSGPNGAEGRDSTNLNHNNNSFNDAAPLDGNQGDDGVDHLDPQARALTVSWLAEVASDSRLHSETLHLAVSLLDRFLSASPARVPRRALQLAAAAAALIAAKHEGEEHGGNGSGIGSTGSTGDGSSGSGGVGGPTPARLAAAADHCFSPADIARMEGAILQALGFRVGAPTSASFSAVLWRLAGTALRQQQKKRKGLCPLATAAAPGSKESKSKRGNAGCRACREHARASYLLELALLDNSMPSALAAAAMLLACEAEAEVERDAEEEEGEEEEGNGGVTEEDPRCAAAAAAAAAVADAVSLRAAAADLARLHAAAAASAQEHAEAYAAAAAAAATNTAASFALAPQQQQQQQPAFSLPPPRPSDAVFARFAQPEWRAVALLPLLSR